MLLLVFVTTLFSSLTKAAYDRTVCDQDAFKAKATQNPGGCTQPASCLDTRKEKTEKRTKACMSSFHADTNVDRGI